ncbi:MAG: FMN-binding protein [Spirochaetaceae bacterium]|nr:FMN-binding protein [Spirochaetaceae bacterium]
MKSSVKLGLILAIFAATACASLAIVYQITKPAIEAQEGQALASSLKELFPEAESHEDITSAVTSTDPSVTIQNAFLVKSALAPLGVAIKATGASYKGPATLLVGVRLDRSITGVRVLDLSDTPGLGGNASNATYYVNKENKITFPGQFTGKYITDKFEVKSDVIPITAATVTSKALTKIVKTASASAGAWLESMALGGAAPSATSGASVKEGQ